MALVPPWCHGPAATAWQQEFTSRSPRRAPSMTYNPQTAQLVKAITEGPWGGEFVRELEGAKMQSLGGELTGQAMEDCAHRVMMRHSGEILNGLAVAEGRALDTTKVPPTYMAALAQ